MPGLSSRGMAGRQSTPFRSHQVLLGVAADLLLDSSLLELLRCPVMLQAVKTPTHLLTDLDLCPVGLLGSAREQHHQNPTSFFTLPRTSAR